MELQITPVRTRRKNNSRVLYAGVRSQQPADISRLSAADRLRRHWHSRTAELQGDAT